MYVSLWLEINQKKLSVFTTIFLGFLRKILLKVRVVYLNLQVVNTVIEVLQKQLVTGSVVLWLIYLVRSQRFISRFYLEISFYRLNFIK